MSWLADIGFNSDDLIRMHIFAPPPGYVPPRRILHLPPCPADMSIPAPPEAVCWSGEHRLPIPVFSRTGALIGYCARGDAWTSDPRIFDAR